MKSKRPRLEHIYSVLTKMNPGGAKAKIECSLSFTQSVHLSAFWSNSDVSVTIGVVALDSGRSEGNFHSNLLKLELVAFPTLSLLSPSIVHYNPSGSEAS